MALNETIFVIIEDNALLRTTKLKPIVDAIKNRNKISFFYSGPRKPAKDSVKQGNRVDAEAVALGLSFILCVEILKLFYIKTYKQLVIVVCLVIIKLLVGHFLSRDITTFIDFKKA